MKAWTSCSCVRGVTCEGQPSNPSCKDSWDPLRGRTSTTAVELEARRSAKLRGPGDSRGGVPEADGSEVREEVNTCGESSEGSEWGSWGA